MIEMRLCYCMSIIHPETDEEVEADCTFYYYPAEYSSYWSGGWPAEVELFSMKVGGEEIIGMFSDSKLDYLESILLEAALRNGE